jgi:Cu+-exporting ATPase
MIDNAYDGEVFNIALADVPAKKNDLFVGRYVVEVTEGARVAVKGNLAFTTLYNIVGLSLAALGILPPVLAAASQSLPDIGIMGNSARLLKEK